MSTTTIAIHKNDICEHIYMVSACTARAREAIGLPNDIIERMIVTKDEMRKISNLIDQSANDLISIITHYYPNSTMQRKDDILGGYNIFNIETPPEYPSGNKETLRHYFESYITNRTLQKWYTDIKPDEANITATKVQNDTNNITNLLTQRTKPTITNN